jgi:cytidine deaminase
MTKASAGTDYSKPLNNLFPFYQPMKKESYQFNYDVYDSSSELNAEDLALLKNAQGAVSIAYAPYSEFNVGAAARLSNGEIITGGNQENASFPAGLCAEGVVMAIAASWFPGIPIDTLAISYDSSKVESDHPISPCGICRQSLQEFQERTGSPVRLIMGGKNGKVFIVQDASALMPLAFRF